MLSFFEEGSELSGSIKFGKFSEVANELLLFKKNLPSVEKVRRIKSF